MICFYGLLKNNVVIKEKVYEDDRMAAKTPLQILYAKLNSRILRVHPLQNMRPQSVNDFWFSKWGN